MVNNFYKTKEREFLLRSKQLEVQLETLVEIRGQLAACKIGDQDDSDKETDICRFDRCRLLAIWVYRGWEWKRNDNSSVSDSSLSVSDRGIQRKLRPKLTFSIFCQIFVLGLLGPVIDQNFSYLGLKLTSPTYACALSNVLPCMTFVIALLLRMEKVNIKKVRGGAKLVGTIVCVGGAMLMTLYRGPIVRMFWSPHHQSSNHNHTSAPAGIAGGSKDWIVGSVLMVCATLAWSILFILQSAVLKKYPAQLSLAALICLLGTLQATALSIALVRDPSKWALGWDINLLTAVYSGVVASAVAYYVQGLCMRVKGPVFATAFSPLVMIIVAVMGSVILSENIYLGSVLGGIMIAIGLYAVLWGKLRDSKASMDENHSEALPSSEEILPQNENNENKADDIEAASNDSMDKGREPFESDGMK